VSLALSLLRKQQWTRSIFHWTSMDPLSRRAFCFQVFVSFSCRAAFPRRVQSFSLTAGQKVKANVKVATADGAIIPQQVFLSLRSSSSEFTFIGLTKTASEGYSHLISFVRMCLVCPLVSSVSRTSTNSLVALMKPLCMLAMHALLSRNPGSLALSPWITTAK